DHVDVASSSLHRFESLAKRATHARGGRWRDECFFRLKLEPSATVARHPESQRGARSLVGAHSSSAHSSSFGSRRLPERGSTRRRAKASTPVSICATCTSASRRAFSQWGEKPGALASSSC